MRRLASVVLLLGIAPLLAPAVHASGRSGEVPAAYVLEYAQQLHATTGHRGVVAVAKAHVGGAALLHLRPIAVQARAALSAVHPSIATGTHSVAAHSASPAAQQASGLRIDPSSFSPATIVTDAIEDNASADKDYFATNHSTTYESLKRVTGYYMIGNFQNAQVFHYMGSVFQDTTSASAALQDGVTATQTTYHSLPPQDCQVTVTCNFLGYTFTPGGTNQALFELYYVASYKQCLIEVTGTAPGIITAPKNANALKSLAATMGNIVDAGIKAMEGACGTAGTTSPTAGTGGTAGPVTVSPTPTPTVGPQPTATPSPVPTQATTDYSVDKVKVQASSNETSKVLKSMKAGKKAYLFIYWTVNSARPGVKPSYNYKGTLKGKRVLHGKFKGGLSSYDPGGYYADFRFTPKKTGKYTFTAVVAFDGQKHQAKTTLKVTK